MFVVCGEVLMDVFAQAETATGLTFDARIGGSPFNVAMGLARLGQPVSFFGGVSRGFVGDRLLRALRDERIGTGAVAMLDAPTTLSLVGVDAQGVPSYTFYGAGAADRMLPAAALATVPGGARAFHFGSYAMVVEPVAATLRQLVERERQRSLIAYDPNVRLNVEPDLDRWNEVLDWMLARAHVVKISEEDLGLLRPGVAAAEIAPQWLAKGVSLVVVTRGGEGALAWTARHHAAVPSVACALVDTVGAGDSFQAALLGWLAERDALAPSSVRDLDAKDLAGALTFATQAAAITCARRGADLPRREALPAIARRVS